MGDLPIPVDGLSKAQHRAHHDALHAFFNSFAKGPFTLSHSDPDIDTGVEIFTPDVGDTIVGLWVETTSVWSVSGEHVGLGIAGTTDADLAFKFPVETVSVPTYPTFGRGVGAGIMMFTETARLLTSEPIIARTVVGGNSSGGLKLRVCVLPATLL